MRVPVSLVHIRLYSKKFSFKKKPQVRSADVSIQPQIPVRTRFAPSPTGYLHLGSLRTALYNFLLAKSTGGQFLLRLEDTDQKRLVKDAEENIYESLKWCNLTVDEGPIEGGPYGPYRQSDRMDIYKKYADLLIEKGHAYYCGCSKERLNDLRESAMKLKPPTTVTYDRHCLYEKASGAKVIRFKSPDSYEPFRDLLHGDLNMQPQYNLSDRRYDDFVIMKSDGLPTYHFANVVDDHLMKITHVIRGEEWLPSTPKHIALYHAFGWKPPSYIHIPLLTSLEDKKLSKRDGDRGILTMREQGILPEALVNFVALFGWSPPRLDHGKSVDETMTLEQIIESFSIDNLTKGNAKVNENKLSFFNKFHLGQRIKNPQSLSILVEGFYEKLLSNGIEFDKHRLTKVVEILGHSITNINDILSKHSYIFHVEHRKPISTKQCQILKSLIDLPLMEFDDNVKKILNENPEITKKDIFQTVRNALSGGVPGLTIPQLIEVLGAEEVNSRINDCIKLSTN